MEKELKYEIFGWTDEIHDCDFCGKSELKSVAIMKNIETGEILYFGCDCARKATGISTSEIKKEAKNKQKILNKERFNLAKNELMQTTEYIEKYNAIEYVDKYFRHSIKERLIYLKPFLIKYAEKKAEIESKYNVEYL